MRMESCEVNSKTLDSLRSLVQSDTPAGFCVFYSLMSPSEWALPEHAVKWIWEYYDVLDNGPEENVAYEAFRGSLKTTVMTIFRSAYRLGCNPTLEVVFGQGNHRAAVENAQHIASLIADVPMWRVLFPDVVPDVDLGWGQAGYQIKRTDIPYGEFRKRRTKVPSFVGAGYASALILGKHPRLDGVLDDVNNYGNTRSPRKLHEVVTKVAKEIRPAFDKCPQIDIFTPWVNEDVGDRAKKRPNTRHIRTPIYKLDGKGELTNVPQWPEEWPEERIQELRDNTAPAEFAQMYLCDLEATKGQALKKAWLEPRYLPENLDSSWPVYIGIDYASVASDQEVRGRDHFALGVIAVHPNGFGILIDGFFGFLPDADAQDVALNWGNNYLNMRAMAIERLGSAQTYYNLMLKNAPFRVKPFGTGNRRKGDRFERQLAPLFKNGKLRLLDDPDNPFLKQFESEWLAWDGLETYYDDCLDAVYYAVGVARNFLRGGADEDDTSWGAIRSRKERIIKSMPGFGFAKRKRDRKNARTR